MLFVVLKPREAVVIGKEDGSAPAPGVYVNAHIRRRRNKRRQMTESHD